MFLEPRWSCAARTSIPFGMMIPQSQRRSSKARRAERACLGEVIVPKYHWRGSRKIHKTFFAVRRAGERRTQSQAFRAVCGDLERTRTGSRPDGGWISFMCSVKHPVRSWQGRDREIWQTGCAVAPRPLLLSFVLSVSSPLLRG